MLPANFARFNMKFRIILILAPVILLLGGCESDEQLVSESKYHPSGWTSFPADESHGVQALKTGILNCYDCHGNDFSGGIAQVACAECHGYGQDNCVACHGGLFDSTGAPPYALDRSINDTILAVGSHYIHLYGSEISDGISCNSCHIVPEHPWDLVHFDYSIYNGPGISDSIAEIVWGGIADSGGIWDRETRTCSDTYCHGNFKNGYPDNSPVWTESDQTLCGSCHDDGSNILHMNRDHILHYYFDIGCENCHAATVDEHLKIIGLEFHVDGQFTVRFYPDSGSYSNGTCYDPGGCHDTQDWH
ncbi:MAG: CxxxxCH/CxxCH domain-containing protein [Candidatus Zixiibacteriota bacterium]